MSGNRDVKNDVVDELAFDPFVDDRNIQVHVHHGSAVTMKGTVPTFAQLDEATDAAWRIGSVTDVNNELSVELDEASIDDEVLADRAANALLWNTSVPEDTLVIVDTGWVTLSGSVNWAYQRDVAYDAVRSLSGVRGVTNNIVVSPAVNIGDVVASVDNAVARNALIFDDSSVDVQASGSTIYLNGHVRTWAERDAVDDAAWMAAGVTGVENRLTVTG